MTAEYEPSTQPQGSRWHVAGQTARKGDFLVQAAQLPVRKTLSLSASVYLSMSGDNIHMSGLPMIMTERVCEEQADKDLFLGPKPVSQVGAGKRPEDP